MNRIRVTLSTAMTIAALAACLGIAAKRPLNHDDFDSWENLKIEKISRSGNWAAYSVTPQAGDGTLYIRNIKRGTSVAIPRGYKPGFSADGKYAVALVKPLYADTRKAKIDGKSGFDLPQDSLAIITLASGHIEKIPNVNGYKIGKKGGDFIAYQSVDTLHIKPKNLKDKEVGKPLVIRSLDTPSRNIVKWVRDYAFTEDGSRLGLHLAVPESDSLKVSGIAVVNLPDTSVVMLDSCRKFYSAPVFNEQGSAMAWTASNDTIKTGTLRATVNYADLTSIPAIEGNYTELPLCFTTNEAPVLAPARSDNKENQEQLERDRMEAMRKAQGDVLVPNQYTELKFSKDGRFLIAGVAPVIAPNDTTLVDFETAGLDIWRWDAPYTPPQEIANLSSLKKKNLPVVIDINSNFNPVLLTRNMLAEVEGPQDWNGGTALIHNPSSHMVERQWNYYAPEELLVVNLTSGETEPVGEALTQLSVLSPEGKYVVTFRDGNYWAYDTSTGEKRNLTGSIPYPVWIEDDDHPMLKEGYGIAGWTPGDADVLVYDKFDIWQIPLASGSLPICLTGGEGRRKNLEMRYRNLKEDSRTVLAGETMVLDLFDFNTKERGLATLKFPGKSTGKSTGKTAGKTNGTNNTKTSKPEIRILDKYRLWQLSKAEEGDVYMWLKGNFETHPELWVSTSSDFAKARKITSVNAHASEISWGTARLVKWTAYNGKQSEGVLYLPEGFDASATAAYPMLSVFYETGSEDLYTHVTMQPSWSWVNYPFYVSRGYAVFVPDIHYDTAGLPGESAYNYVCSGVESILKEYPAIDPERVGIDGQSWGGYQTAYLVTRTDMFACAGSGAPVANMTSAFGGIRWGTGDSRQAQYEMGQSRIGRNLWDAPELYIANSPVFHANRVHTPLLIMHNDNDGAVPWYQGIELFMALRRLQKPVWMLQYNGEEHNIVERRNRKDITIRLQQFFDHYLKGEPMPRWMKEGISPLRKGQDFGF